MTASAKRPSQDEGWRPPSIALVLVDFINDFQFEGAEAIFPRALRAAKATAALKARAKRSGIPAIYANDNFGRWRSDFRSLLEHCLSEDVRGSPIARLLKPEVDDYFILKPKHSAFQSTALELLLGHLGVRTLILTGVATNICVLFSAHDAYMRDFRLLVPRDCVASEDESDHRHALEHMATVCKADVRPSLEIEEIAETV